MSDITVHGPRALGAVDRDVARREVLGFMLAGEAYAIDLHRLSEILRPLPITEIPRTSSEVLGVMSVRGRLVTVFDLRQRFCLVKGAAMDRSSRIVLVDVATEVVGLLVDRVLGVIRLAEDEIEPPAVLGGDPPPHVVGVARPRAARGASEESPAEPPLPLVLLDLRPLLATFGAERAT